MIQDVFERVAATHADRIAVTDGDEKLRYDELFLRKERLRAYFSRELSLNRKDTIALFLPNCIDFVCAFFAAADIGAVAVPLNIHLKEKELQHYMTQCGIAAVITHGYLMSHWGEIPLQNKQVKFVQADQLAIPPFSLGSGWTPEQERRSAHPVTLDTEVLYLSTSGSTGRPKIIPKTHSILIAGAENLGRALAITSRDTFLSVAPFFHANGFENCMLLPLLRGASCVLMRQFHPRNLLEILEKGGITVLIGSPFIFSSLLDVAGQARTIPTLRFCLSTGAPLPPALKKAFFDAFGVTIRQAYGSSETGHLSVQGDTRLEDTSVGRPLENVRVKIVDDDGQELPPGRTGEILIRSNSMINGYLNEPDLNQESFTGGFFRTGDLGRIDQDGNIHISGRKKWLINAAGVKIDPVEIRNVLLACPKVKDAFVTGVKSKRGLEMVKALVVAQPGCGVNDIIAFCRERLADYKIPRVIEFRDSLPSDIMGKVFESQINDET